MSTIVIEEISPELYAKQKRTITVVP